jgi:hypothetical protein
MNIRAKAIEAWNRFFFQPIPACSLGLFRIVFACVLLVTVTTLAEDALVWYGEEGVVPAAVARQSLEGPRLNLLTILPQSDLTVRCFFAVLLLAGVSLLIGYKTRLASIVVWACLVSMHHRDVFLLHSGDHLMRTLSFFLMFAPSGRAYSVDRLLGLRRGLESPGIPYIVPWAQRLLQIQLCVMYFSAVLYKLAGTHWLDGTAAWYISQLDEFKRFPLPDLAHTLWFSQLATWSALAVEAAFPLLVWFRPLRRYVLLAGVLLHLGLEYTMNIPFFQWVVLASYCLFLDTWMGKPHSVAVSRPQSERATLSARNDDSGAQSSGARPRQSQMGMRPSRRRCVVEMDSPRFVRR